MNAKRLALTPNAKVITGRLGRTHASWQKCAKIERQFWNFL
jgi:ribosomal protein L35